MKEYQLTFKDFKRVFEFGTQYYIAPNKSTTGRTSFEPRGLGAVLDSFTIGKLTEIGVEKILYSINPQKRYLLDFSIKNTLLVKDEPDIIGIVEKGEERRPNIFIEIKNTSEKNGWIGVTEEQFNTIERSAKGVKVYFVYASIFSKTIKQNPKTADLTGMFLKEIEDVSKSSIFQVFAKLNARCRLEFIISDDELRRYGFVFERGMYMYDTEPIKIKDKKIIYKKSGSLRKDVVGQQKFNHYRGVLKLAIKDEVYPSKSELTDFKVEGSFILFKKKTKTFIECVTDVKVENEVFGTFCLKAKKIYTFNLKTVGRDPTLKRNNLFISKRKLRQLINNGKIDKPEKVIKEIAKNI